jgi:hypothetical protein
MRQQRDSNSASGVTSRGPRVRQSNDGIARRARQLHFVARVPFLCECDDHYCREFVPLFLDEYERARREGLPIKAPKHNAD